MTDIETVKALIGNTTLSDDLISFYLDSTERLVKGYCNIKAIPEDLKPTLLEMTALRVKANTNGSQGAIGEGLKAVAGVTDGNQSVSYVTGQASYSFATEADLLLAYGTVLDRYRRLVVKSPRICKTLGSRVLRR